MENSISALPPGSAELTLRSSDLTTTSHLSHLAHLSALDLSHNSLRGRLAQGHLLQGVRVLDLSHNRLTGAGGICHLGYLERINLEHNGTAAVLQEFTYFIAGCYLFTGARFKL